MTTTTSTSLLISLACVALLACGDDGGGGTAGGPAPLPLLGEPCTSTCGMGLTCQQSGTFFDLCSVGCNNDGACGQLRPGTVCVGTSMQCALPCSEAAPCLPGAQCAEVGGKMVCIAAPT